jgi:uncharacterized membrane protein YgcG
MTADTNAAALWTRLEAIVKEAEDTEEKAAAACRRVQAARLLLEEEETKAAALEQTATTARQRVLTPSAATSASQIVPTTSSSYEDTVIASLHLQAATILNVHQLVNIILDFSTNYASWCDLMEQALQRYALIKHVTDDTPSNDSGWIRMGSIVLNWISNSISSELHQVVRERGCTAHHLWLAIDNREQCTLHLDAAFRNFVQGNLSMSKYCRKFKAMANGLADLDSPVEDRILILNILQGLNQRFEHMGYIIQRYSSFPNFLKVQDDLLLEEIHMDSTGAAPTTIYPNAGPPATKPPSSTPSRPPSGGNGGNRNKNNNKNRNSGNGGGNNGKNSNGGGGRSSSSGQTTAPTASDGRTGASWPTLKNPHRMITRGKTGFRVVPDRLVLTVTTSSLTPSLIPTSTRAALADLN